MEKVFKFILKYKTWFIVAAVSLLTIILCIIYKQHIKHFFHILSNCKDTKKFILNFGPFASLVFIMLQIAQVVVFFIPGEFIQAAGGYIFGTWEATIFSILGINIGATVLFLLTKKYGIKLVNRFVPDIMMKQFEKVMNSNRLNLIVFLIYFLPGLPKDNSIFLCGITRINLRDFLIYSTLGRLPALVLTSYYGANIAGGNKGIVIAITFIIVLVVALGIGFKDQIFKSLAKVS